MSNILKDIEQEANFLELMKELRGTAVWPLSAFFEHDNDIDLERAKLAHAKYKHEIDRFATYLDSSNPDHYKRCGALLQALLANPVVKHPDIDLDPDEIKNGFSRFPYGEEENVGKAVAFHAEYFVTFASLDLCMRLCRSYEIHDKDITFDTIHCICHYVKYNDLKPDSYYMIFKLLIVTYFRIGLPIKPFCFARLPCGTARY